MDQWEAALATGMEVHCLGDMNINHCNWSDANLPSSNQSYKLRGLISDLFQRILTHGVVQLVNGPTRHFPGQVSSGLDHFYTNRCEKISNVEKYYNGGSDHMVISAVRFSKNIQAKPKYLRKRCYKYFDPVYFKDQVQQIKWLDVYLATDVNQAVEVFTAKIRHILDEMAPMRIIQLRNNFSPWLSDETVQLMKSQNDLLKLASSTKTKEDWARFKAVRNRVTNKQKYEANYWKKVKLDSCGGNVGRIWKNIKHILNWTNAGSPNQLFYHGKLLTKAQDIANAQNEYFCDKVNNILSNILPSRTDPLETLKSLMRSRKCSLNLSTVHPDEVRPILSGLSNSSSYGLDLLDSFIIKLIQDEILPVVTHIVNLSIVSQEFPVYWKRTKIVPLFKKGDKSDPKNYRPVAIVPILSKVLERVIFNQLSTYLEINNLIHPNHHAYRKNHNTTTALVQMYDGWLKALDDSLFTGICLLDMSAAFDTVNHELLLKKLKLYGLNDAAIKWIDSYLSSRFQCVAIEGCLSKIIQVNSGVPQGSILGPLLYTLFINELPEVIRGERESEGSSISAYHANDNGCSACCYADDTTLSCSAKTSDELTLKLSLKYDKIATFMRDNKLKLNDEKLHLMVLDTCSSKMRYEESRKVRIRTPGVTIGPSKTEKLLGCWIHENLKWSEHLVDNSNSLLRQLNQRLGALQNICKLTNFKNRKIIANGLFISKIYLIWGGCSGQIQKTLQVVLHKTASLVSKCDWSVSTKETYKQIGWLSLRQPVFYYTVLLLYKIRKNEEPTYLHNMFRSRHVYDTRGAESGAIQIKGRPKLELTKIKRPDAK